MYIHYILLDIYYIYYIYIYIHYILLDIYYIYFIYIYIYIYIYISIKRKYFKSIFNRSTFQDS